MTVANTGLFIIFCSMLLRLNDSAFFYCFQITAYNSVAGMKTRFYNIIITLFVTDSNSHTFGFIFFIQADNKYLVLYVQGRQYGNQQNLLFRIREYDATRISVSEQVTWIFERSTDTDCTGTRLEFSVNHLYFSPIWIDTVVCKLQGNTVCRTNLLA